MVDFIKGVIIILKDIIVEMVRSWRNIGQFCKDLFSAQNRGIMHLAALIILACLVYAILPMPAIFPIERSIQSKLAHFLVGGICAYLFWYVLEQHRRAHLVNPFNFGLGCLWGASGLFFIRWLSDWIFDTDVPIIGSLLYAAFPDWDLVILGIGAHRNLFFHSSIAPILIMVISLQWKKLWLRDVGMGLTIGIASHLLWDIISVANWPYQYIRHLDGFAGALWTLSNAIIGVFFAYYLVGKSSLPYQKHQDRIDDAIS